MVRHHGMFQFNDDVTDEQVAESLREMKAMAGKIPGLEHMEHGSY